MGSFITWAIITVAIWAVCAAIAASVAPDGRSLESAILTFIVLGPLGVGFAAIAIGEGGVLP